MFIGFLAMGTKPGLLKDKTMHDKFTNIPDDNKQNFQLKVENCLLKGMEISGLRPTI